MPVRRNRPTCADEEGQKGNDMFGINFRNCINYEKHGWILDGNPDFRYRSVINHFTCNCPDCWMSATAHNENGQTATIWWYVNNPDAENLEDVVNNWAKCADIEVA